MFVSTNSKHDLTDVLNPDELENLKSPEAVDEVPNARVSEWEDMTAVVSPGRSIAGYMHRFNVNDITPRQRKMLNGLHSDIVGDRSQAVFMSDDLKGVVGDKAYVRLSNNDRTFAVDVRSAEDVYETLEKYEEQYADDVIQSFEKDIEANNIVLPVNYDEEGVLSEVPAAVMTGPEVMANEVEPMQMVRSMLEPEEVNDLMDKSGYLRAHSTEATTSSDAEYEVEVMVPPDCEVEGYQVETGYLIMETENGLSQVEFIDNDLAGEAEIAGENNGVYTVEVR